jgi:hypothetical protein
MTPWLPRIEKASSSTTPLSDGSGVGRWQDEPARHTLLAFPVRSSSLPHPELPLLDGEPRVLLPEPGDEHCKLGFGPDPDEDAGDGWDHSEVGLHEVG